MVKKLLVLTGLVVSSMSLSQANVVCPKSGFMLELEVSAMRATGKWTTGDKFKSQLQTLANELTGILKTQATTETNNLKAANQQSKDLNLSVVATTPSTTGTYDYSYKGQVKTTVKTDGTGKIVAYTSKSGLKYMPTIKINSLNYFSKDEAEYTGNADNRGGNAIIVNQSQIMRLNGNDGEKIYTIDTNKIDTVALPSTVKVEQGKIESLISEKGTDKDGKEVTIDKTKIGEPVYQFLSENRTGNLYLLSDINSSSDYKVTRSMLSLQNEAVLKNTTTASLPFISDPWAFSQVSDMKKFAETKYTFVDGDTLGSSVSSVLNSYVSDTFSSTDELSFVDTKKWGFAGKVRVGYQYSFGNDLSIAPGVSFGYSGASFKMKTSDSNSSNKNSSDSSSSNDSDNPEISMGMSFGFGLTLNYQISSRMSIWGRVAYELNNYKIKMSDNFVNKLKFTGSENYDAISDVVAAVNKIDTDDTLGLAKKITEQESAISNLKLNEEQKMWKGALELAGGLGFNVSSQLSLGVGVSYTFASDICKNKIDNFECKVSNMKISGLVKYVF